MGYLVFARKYRPQNFQEVVGQDEVVSQVTKAIKEKRIHHAYILSGPRGVGKTTLARILSKALNCQAFDDPTIEPCGKCASCIDIQEGKSVDVIEIDGASNTGVDSIRELRESVKFAPSYGRYKVYIIDEVHRISQNAFDALLKTLEEPPSHVKFIFATTELSKVPITILSRCQKFNFSLVSQNIVIQKLKKIAESEGIKVEEDVFKYVAKASMGSIRDAESIFDQIVPLLLEGGNLDSVLDMLGEIKEYLIFDFVKALVSLDAKVSLEIIDGLVKEGKDLGKFLSGSVEFLRNLMLAKVVKESFSKFGDIPQELKEDILALAVTSDIRIIVKAIDYFVEVRRVSRALDSFRIPLEVAIVRLIYSKQAQPKNIQQTTQQTTQQAAPQTVQQHNYQPKPAAVVKPKEVKEPVGEGHLTADRQVVQPFKRTAATLPKKASLNLDGLSEVLGTVKKESVVDKPEPKLSESSDLDAFKSRWPGVLAELSKTRMSIAASVQNVKLMSLDKGTLTIGFPENLSFNRDLIANKPNTLFLEKTILDTLKEKVHIKCMLIEETAPVPDKRRESKEMVDNIMDVFGGEIVA